MREKQTRFSLKNKLTLASIIMVVLPVVLTGICYTGIRMYLFETMGANVFDSVESPRAVETFFVDMFVAIVFILLFSSFILRRWIDKGMVNPIGELSVAMEEIKKGNLDYRLNNNYSGEIATLFEDYEAMRLRLKESIEEGMENEKTSKELVSNISHDLKTPITAIKGYVEGIMDGVADTPEKMDKYIKTIYNKANDMDSLINELTIYSKIDSNRIPYNFHRINV